MIPSFKKYFGDLSKDNSKNPHIKAVETGYYTKVFTTYSTSGFNSLEKK